MSGAMIPFAAGSQLPAYLQTVGDDYLINREVGRTSFPHISIKGKVFKLVKDGEGKILTKPDAPDEVLQFIQLAVLRANAHARVYYEDSYKDGDSDGKPPTCQSADGITPNADAREPQANKCAVCPHAVWFTAKDDKGEAREGTACSVNTRLAVADPDKLDEPFLLRVPAASKKNFSDAVKAASSRKIPYTALVMRVGFDPESSSPKLTFKPVGLLSDAAYAEVKGAYDSDLVREIVGLREPVSAAVVQAVSGPVSTDELDAAISAKAAVSKAAAPAGGPAPVKAAAAAPKAAPPKAAPAPAPAPAPKAAPPKAAPAPAPASMDGLLEGLDTLLGSTDD